MSRDELHRRFRSTLLEATRAGAKDLKKAEADLELRVSILIANVETHIAGRAGAEQKE
jgi:hypothetical protein